MAPRSECGSAASSPSSSSESSVEQPNRSLNEYQQQGALCQRWISKTPLSSDEPRYIPRCCPTLAEIQCLEWKMKNNLSWKVSGAHMDYREWRDGVHDHAAAIGLLEADPSMDDAIYRESWLELNTPEDHAYWGGRVRKGMLFIHETRAGDLPSTLRISVVSHAVYARDFLIETLRYVYVHNVLNDDTLEFLQAYLYTQKNGFPWDDCYEYKSWEFGMPQYQGLLGTKVGKLVAALVLGAFEPGTRRIARIVTGGTYMVNLRFDIEVVEQVE